MLRHWINGEVDAPLGPGDRGLQYGDGVFETMAVRAGSVRHWARHLARLGDGCARLGIPAPRAEDLAADVARAAAVPGAGIVKLIVTRGSGGRGYRAPAEPHPTRIVYAHAPPDYPAQWADDGVVVRFCQTRLSLQPALAGIKHLNRLEQVLARSEWQDPACAEGLMQDTDGRVVGGTMSNVFVVTGGVWRTPMLERCGVRGTMRAGVLEAAARGGQTVVETDLTPADLEAAEEVFLTNAAFGVWPVARLGGRVYAGRAAARRAQAWVRDFG